MNAMNRISRRTFLEASGRMMAGAGLAGGVAARASAAEARKTAVGVRDAHLREVGERDGWSALRAIGATCAEVVVSPALGCSNLAGPDGPHSIATGDDVRRLGDAAKANGIRISAFCMSNRFDERPDEEVKWLSDVARACKTLDVRAIRIDVVPRRIRDDDEFLQFAVKIGKRIVEATDETGVRFGIENHGNMSNRVEFLDRLFDGVESDRIGLTLDTANFYWFGYPLSQLYEIYTKFASRVHHTHCKNIAYPEERRNVKRPRGWEYGKYNCPVYDGDIDFKRVVAILRKAGYPGDLCIENESLGKFPKEKRREVLAKEVSFLKALL